jgi:group II intron reverse transcriptase/maturase
MQSAQTRLSILKQKSEHDEYYKFKRLFRNLYNPDFYLRAYQKLSQKEGNHTLGIDNATIDGFSLQTVQNLIELQKTGKYKPKPSKRVYIPKKNGKLRPLGIPCFEDKVIHEIVREILEAIYEHIFCDSSHGFRPNRSCQTALHQIKNKAAGTNWVIEVDITRFFENIDHNTLMKLLAKKIKDGRILDLIRRFLKGGTLISKKFIIRSRELLRVGGLSPRYWQIYICTHLFNMSRN